MLAPTRNLWRVPLLPLVALILVAGLLAAAPADTAQAQAQAAQTVPVVEDTSPSLLERYDADNSGAIEKAEVIKAIDDYLFGTGTDAITKEQTIEVINLYLFGGPPPTPTPRYQIATRDQEYVYTIDVPEGWVDENDYAKGGRLDIREIPLTAGTKLDQFAESVRDNLRREWWPSASVFEITHFSKRQAGDQEFYSLKYRVRESPEYCLVDVEEVIGVGASLPEQVQGFRALHEACDWMLQGRLGMERRQVLDSFRVTTRPATYYKQFIMVEGVTVKATGKVDQAALQVVAGTVDVMLDGRRDIRECLVHFGAGLAIVPRDELITTLPEFAHLKGKKDPFWGNSYDVHRALGGLVSAVPEENLLRLPESITEQHSTVHEFAHTIQNRCFTPEDHQEWNALYSAAREDGILSGAYAMTNPREFFAVLSSVYFGATYELGRLTEVRPALRAEWPAVFEFLEDIYGALTPPPTTDPDFVRFLTSDGSLVPWWRLHAEWGTYQDAEFGYSVDIMPGWRQLEWDSNHTTIWKYRYAWFWVTAFPFTDPNQLRNYAEEVRDLRERHWASAVVFEIDSFEEYGESGQTAYLITGRLQEKAEDCLRVRRELITLSSEYDEKPYVFHVGAEVCEESRIPYVFQVQARDISDMMASFR